VAHLSVDEFTSELKAGAPSLRFLQGRGFAQPQTVTDDLDIDPSRPDSASMPWGLKRFHGTGHLHFITCSCYRRLPLLGKPGRRTLFLELLEQTRQRYDFVVVGYVVMPEHFHILIGEPERGTPSTVLQVVKQRFARRVLRALRQRKRKAQPTLWREDEDPWAHIWQARFYDFNVWTRRKQVEKLRYMHENPVKRGLVLEPGQWAWSSFRDYAQNHPGLVKLNQWPTARLKVTDLTKPKSPALAKNARTGHPL
jgi:putative transposase